MEGQKSVGEASYTRSFIMGIHECFFDRALTAEQIGPLPYLIPFSELLKVESKTRS